MSGEDRTPRRPPRFAPTEHLASEAIAAYVDGELRMNAYLRAAQHLSQCRECAAEVHAQEQARIALRQSQHITAPMRLHDTLSRIPLSELPGAQGNPPGPRPGNQAGPRPGTPAGPHAPGQPGPHAPDPTPNPADRRRENDLLRGVSSFGLRQDSFDSRRWTSWWRK
ncbi:hypothetical protein JK358_17055 [Nocardia sp. 2]|uniref:Zinc finger protein n=1 Tax=Nocardia acididurans TaxID=2802282 RepID=A0ABS1M6E6_9NOCA|nr:hypothetical protein [Nocardia acididurans]